MVVVETSHGFRVRLEGVPFAEAEERTTAALGEEGFGVPSEIDVQALEAL